MSATTWALIFDELMDSEPEPEWGKAGLHVLEPGPYEYPGVRWWKLQDDTAPETLDGKRVEYQFSQVDGEPQITGRRPA